MQKEFIFIYPLTKRKRDIRRPGGWRYVHMGDLTVSGLATVNRGPSLDNLEDRYKFDFDYVMYQGINIYPVLENFDSLDSIIAACFHHINHLFTGEYSEYRVPDVRPMPKAKILSLPLKRKTK